jgi:hypothetical protein
MKVLSVSPRTDTMVRTKGIDTAIGTFKADRFGAKGYIPAGHIDIAQGSPTFGQVTGPFLLQNSYTGANANSFEAQYISQVFGTRVNLADLGGAWALGTNTIPLDANQTLLFFLGGMPEWDGQGNASFTGFANDPAKPFSRATPGESRKGPYLDISRKMIALDSPTAFPRLVDGYGSPFAYFSAYNGKTNTMSGALNNAYAIGGVPRQAMPYMNGTKFVNDTGWQIISAGEDKVFVAGATGPVNWSSVDAGSRDNLANFSTKILGAGPSAQ